MATLQEIYSYEKNIQNQCMNMLSGSGVISGSVRWNEVNQTPAIRVRFQKGTERLHYKIVGNKVLTDMIDGNLSFYIVTERSQEGDLHDGYVGLVRSYFMNESNYNSSSVSSGSLYHFYRITEQGTEYTQNNDSDKNYDITTINYSVVLGVRPEVWPNL